MQPTPELLEYVRAQRVAGFSDDVLRQVMIASGWSPDVVDQALRPIVPPVSEPVNIPTFNTYIPPITKVIPETHNDFAQPVISKTPVTQPEYVKTASMDEIDALLSPTETPISSSGKKGKLRIVIILIIIAVLAAGGGFVYSRVGALLPTSLSLPSLSVLSIPKIHLPSEITGIVSRLPLIGDRIVQSDDSEVLATPANVQAIIDSLSILRTQPRVGTHMQGMMRIDAVSTETPAEDIMLSFDSTRIGSGEEYTAYALARATTPKSVELDAQLYITSAKATIRFNAMTLLSALGIDTQGAWIGINDVPTELAVIDQIGLPGSVIESYLTAQRQTTNTQPLLVSFLSGETVRIDDPMPTLHNNRHVRIYHLTAHPDSLAAMIAQQLRMRGGLLLPAEEQLQTLLHSFTTLTADIVVDVATGLPSEMSVHLVGTAASGSGVSLDMDFTFVTEPILTIIEEPTATNSLTELIDLIVQTLKDIPEEELTTDTLPAA